MIYIVEDDLNIRQMESYALKNGGRRSDLRALYWMKDASGRYRIIGEARIRK